MKITARRTVWPTLLLCATLACGLPRAAHADHEGKLTVLMYVAPPVALGSLITLVGTAWSLADDTPGPPTGWAIASIVFGTGALGVGLWSTFDDELPSGIGVGMLALGLANITLGIVGLLQDDPPAQVSTGASVLGMAPTSDGVVVTFGGRF
jgi:hypothetical protein